MGLVGERKALASAVLALYALFFTLNALLIPERSLVPLLGSMAATYGLAFFALVAGYFWARWFAIGLGLYGVSTGVLVLWQLGIEPIFVFYTGTHLAVSLLLWGKQVSADFDGRNDWRERFHMDESGTHRLGRAVIRAGISLPFLLAYGLAPRDGEGMTLAVAVLALAGLGIWGLLRLRTWGVLAMVVAGIVAVVDLSGHAVGVGVAANYPIESLGAVGAALLLAATTPFALPMLRHLRG
ncbi:hypothetical protein [Haliangium sp.]|uniref:hypothetical protein n=1 Tax=Haliangium sp. TaxID=2663208 RepID=UPI003D10A2E1